MTVGRAPAAHNPSWSARLCGGTAPGVVPVAQRHLVRREWKWLAEWVLAQL